MNRDNTDDASTNAGPSRPEESTPDDITRRVFLERLQRTATFVVPVVAAIALTPSKALAY